MLIQNRNTYTDGIENLDPYFTCPEAVASLLRLEGERLPQRIWEPACGDGAIVRPLIAAGRDVIASDIHAYDGRPDDRMVFDYLATPPFPDSIEGIVTNPPYRQAQAFAEKALVEAPYVALLVRSNFYVEAAERDAFFAAWPPTRVWLSSRRLPAMHRYRWTGNRVASNTPYCWLVWERGMPPSLPQRFDWRKLLDRARKVGAKRTFKQPAMAPAAASRSPRERCALF
jgi:hypothetical protein